MHTSYTCNLNFFLHFGWFSVSDSIKSCAVIRTCPSYSQDANWLNLFSLLDMTFGSASPASASRSAEAATQTCGGHNFRAELTCLYSSNAAKLLTNPVANAAKLPLETKFKIFPLRKSWKCLVFGRKNDDPPPKSEGSRLDAIVDKELLQHQQQKRHSNLSTVKLLKFLLRVTVIK